MSKTPREAAPETPPAGGPLEIRMLGGFSLSWEGRSVDGGENRSRMVWLLLAYMICNRARPIPREELDALLWGNGEKGVDTANALKALFHRARAALDPLGRSAGQTLLLRQGGRYAWNTRVSARVDAEEFLALSRRGDAADGGEERLALFLQALELYRGDFLPRLSSHPWAAPICARLHERYLDLLLEALPLLEARGRREEAASLCRRALETDPCHEELNRRLLRLLLDLGDLDGAARSYESMRELLDEKFGVLPAEDLRAMYRRALRSPGGGRIPPDELGERLREGDGEQGALLCDFDLFQLLCRALSRRAGRSGEAAHVCLLTVAGADGGLLARRSLDRVMENLRELIRRNLRRGDAAAACSASQYAILLPQADYESSRMVCRRITRAFSRQYPHSPARLRCAVQPLEPSG